MTTATLSEDSEPSKSMVEPTDTVIPHSMPDGMTAQGDSPSEVACVTVTVILSSAVLME